MNINWRHTLLIAADVALAAYFVMAVTSWRQHPMAGATVCSKVDIHISDSAGGGFLKADEVRRLLDHAGLYPLGTRMAAINPRKIEQGLVRMPFVNTAQCYATTDGHVCIDLTQRTPVLRVKSQTGDDYYVDNLGGIMPNSRYTSDIVIATGAISRAFACQYLTTLASTIGADPMWNRQIEQINVRPDRAIEIVPRCGNHIVCLGRLPGTRHAERRQQQIHDFTTTQLDRLRKFYQYGLSHAGWNKYSYISLEYNNQIVCKRHE